MKDLNVKTNWTTADVQEFQALLDRMIELTGFRLNLDEDERKAHPPIADGRIPYCDDCEELAGDHQAVLSIPDDEVEEIRTSAQDFKWVSHFLQELDTFRTGFSDARHMIGANYLSQSRNVHGAVKLAAQKGKPGMRSAQKRLDDRFAAQGNYRPKENGGTDSNGGNNPAPNAQDQPA